MIKRKLVQKEVEEVEDILCNLCGKSLYDGVNYNGLTDAEMKCGYGSKWDGTIFKFSLCEDCMEELMNKFKLSAEENWYEW